MNSADFRELAYRNPANPELLSHLAALGLPDCHLVAGCLFQTVWNCLAGNRPADRIKDYDVFYFDEDLSAEAEAESERRVMARISHLPIRVDVKNQARVHLWYEAKFGPGYPRLLDARDGIGRYLVACTCVGIAAATGEITAPFGFGELAMGVLRMNPVNPRPDLFVRKAQSYRSRWPWLTIVDPPDGLAQEYHLA